MMRRLPSFGLPLAAACSLAVLLAQDSTASGYQSYRVIEETLYPSDAEDFVSTCDSILSSLGQDVYLVGAIRYDADPFGGEDETNLAIVAALGTSIQWSFMNEQDDWDIVYAAVVACGTVTEQTSWHSDFLKICFLNGKIWISTQDCREFCESYLGQSPSSQEVRHWLRTRSVGTDDIRDYTGYTWMH